MSDANVTVKLVKSVSGRLKNHRACVHGLGLRKIGQSVNVKGTPENWGMINKVRYMLEVGE